MGTRISIQEIMLKPGVDVEEFENFVKNEASTFVWTEGMSHRFAKYTSGEERSAYVLIFEDSTLSREEREKLQDELNKGNPHNQAILDKLDSYIAHWSDGKRISTQYSLMD